MICPRNYNPLWAIPGTVAALWTPETWKSTASTLITAASLSGWAASTGTGTWMGKIGSSPGHVGGPHQYPHIQLNIWRQGIKGSGKALHIRIGR